MDLSVPRSESQRTQKLAHGRVREGEEMETWLRWARQGKGCSVLALCARVSCRIPAGVLRKPQFQILFPPASSMTLAVVRRCVPILVSRNKQRSAEVLSAYVAGTAEVLNEGLMGHQQSALVTLVCEMGGDFPRAPGMIDFWTARDQCLLKKGTECIWLEKEPIAMFQYWHLLVEWGTTFQHSFIHSFTPFIDCSLNLVFPLRESIKSNMFRHSYRHRKSSESKKYDIWHIANAH